MALARALSALGALFALARALLVLARALLALGFWVEGAAPWF